MDVERKRGCLANGSDDRRTYGDVRDEMAVHDVHVNPICSRGSDRADLIREAPEGR